MRPSEPGSTEAASERMSPKRFSVQMTSKCEGAWASVRLGVRVKVA